MAYDYDLLCIGLGPAGMAVSIMGSEMGLRVCAVEKEHVGGECMNVGCIPSKAILQIARHRHFVNKLPQMGLEAIAAPQVIDPFAKIQAHLKYISEKKTMGMFKKVDLLLGQGAAEFIDPHTVRVGERKISAKRIFIATGTKPMVLPCEGIETIDYLTNETIFSLDKVPQSLIVKGGGAIACEMAQAFARLGSKVSLVQRSGHILSKMDSDAAALVEESFRKEGIALYTGRLVTSVRKDGAEVVVVTDKGEEIRAERVLEAVGRRYDYSALKLENAGVAVAANGSITVNKYLQTSRKHIYAVGDCNGHHLFSHAAMHQGMMAIMNSMMPWPMKRNFRKYVVPYTVFTEPQLSGVGLQKAELDKRGIKYEEVRVNYADYGAAIAEEIPEGFVKAYIGRTGKILGACIIGEGSGEMINEWALAVQKGLRITDIMFLQHSFPTMGFLSKRVSETWMMGKMGSEFLKKCCRFFFSLGF